MRRLATVTLASLLLILLAVATLFRVAPVSRAQVADNIGPELAFFDPGNQREVYNNAVRANGHTGAVQVINTLGDVPYNPAPGTRASLRIAGFGPTTPLSAFESYASQLRNSSEFPEGTIVIVGNELNNLTLEYQIEAEFNDAGVLRQAGRTYAQQYMAFARVLRGSKYRLSPAPPDLYNGLWDPVPFIDGFVSGLDCSLVDVLVANIFDGVTPRVPYDSLNAYKYLEDRICGKKVVHFGGVGVDPNVQPPISLAEQVKFLDDFQLPPGVETATSLLIDPCKNSNVTKADWLFYIPKGQAYDKNGVNALRSDCEDRSDLSPVFIYPRNPDEISKYLSNAQVYCAPMQIYQPVDPAIMPDLPNCTPAGDQDPGSPFSDRVINNPPVCNETQYPLVRGEEKIDLSRLSFPLFRNQSGGISIEADLSKTTPGETIAEVLQQGTRSHYAPQFYLSSPETQCLNAVRYIQYAQRLCSEWRPGKSSETCGANLVIPLPDGGQTTVLEAASRLGSEESCVNFSQQLALNTERAQIVRSLQPYLPKVFKIGFLVQHNWLYDRQYPLFGQFLVHHLAAWFEGSQTQPDFGNSGGEKVTIVPIWYNAGISVNEYDQNQVLPYSIDPTNLPTEPQLNPSNFAGSFWRTYSELLPITVQQSMASDKIKLIDQNYQLMQQILRGNLIGQSGYSLTYKNQIFKPATIPPITECSTPRDCLCFKEGPNDETCLNQTYDEVRQAFPEDFEPDNGYLDQLKLQLLARINAGIQESVSYPTELETTSGTEPNAGPLSQRTFVRCQVDSRNELFGQVEETQSILSAASQALNDVKSEPSPDNLRKAITEISASIVAKVRPKNYLDPGGRPDEQRKQRAYVVLPDEAMNIDIEQSYITSMFLSPQMYASIMEGTNPVYPFNLNSDGTLKPESERKPLSAFLRMVGLGRLVEAEAVGYARTKTTIYNTVCQAEDQCSCGNTVIFVDDSPRWVEYDPDYDDTQPTIENGCRKEEYSELSLVGMRGEPEGTEPDANPQTPGQLAALHEFLRRQAFTPTHQQAYTLYPGLEQFYQALGISEVEPGVSPTLPSITGVSDYFRALMNGIGQSYALARPSASCDVMYVSQADASRYAADLVAATSRPQIFDWLMQRYTRANPFGTCAGMPCTQFIAQVTTSVPICGGDRYLNPLMAFAIALSEGGITGRTGFFYGCGIASFQRYKPGASVNGLACTVNTATGQEVINPALMAQSSPASLTTQVLNTCIDQTGGRNTSRNNSVEDGLACLLAYSQGSCVIGRNDLQLLTGYEEGGNPAYGQAKINHLDELATQIKRAATANGIYDAEIMAVEQRLRNHASELRRRLNNCQ